MKWRLVAALIGLTLVVLLVHDIPLANYLRTVESDRITTALERDSFVIAGRSEDVLTGSAPDKTVWLQNVLINYNKTSGAHVIVTDANGLLLASSDSTDVVGDSYTSRQEVQEALNGRVNNTHRFSQKLNQDMFFVAVPVLSGEKILGVVRLNFPYSNLQTAVDQRLRSVTIVAVITLLLATFVAIILASSITRRLRELKISTEKFTEGDYSSRADIADGAPEIKSLAASFNSMADRLTSLIEQQRAFAGDASHQLRTPLTALQLRLERAAELIDTDPAGAAERLEAAMNETERMQRLVEGLLVLSRAENSENLIIQEFDLVKIVKERVGSWEHLAAEHGVELKLNLPEAAMVKAVPGAAEQVIDNYIDNAIEIVPKKTTIEVTISTEGAFAGVHVLDQGPGMSESDLTKAFNRFWRGRSDQHGSGLGLAIVDRLLRAGGGHAILTNRAQGGLDAAGYFLTVS